MRSRVRRSGGRRGTGRYGGWGSLFDPAPSKIRVFLQNTLISRLSASTTCVRRLPTKAPAAPPLTKVEGIRWGGRSDVGVSADRWGWTCICSRAARILLNRFRACEVRSIWTNAVSHKARVRRCGGILFRSLTAPLSPLYRPSPGGLFGA